MACLETQVLLDHSHRDNSKWVAQAVLIACSEVDLFNLLKLKTKATRLLYSCLLRKASRKLRSSSKWADKVRVRLRARHKVSSRS